MFALNVCDPAARQNSHKGYLYNTPTIVRYLCQFHSCQFQFVSYAAIEEIGVEVAVFRVTMSVGAVCAG